MSNNFSFSMALFISVVAFAALLPSPALSTSAAVTGYNGEFHVDLLIGTNPATSYSLVLDTDSDLIWAANRTPSTSYSRLPCNSIQCTQAKGICDKGYCQTKYISTNLSTTYVHMATETFTFNNTKVPNLAFAYAAVENVTGGLGLGRGPLSLVSQTKASKLSFCLPDYDYANKKGFLNVGYLAKSHHKMITTSLVNNPPSNPSAYYIKVIGMSVNNARLPIGISAFGIDTKTGRGGFVLDTGSTMSYLNGSIFNALKEELAKHIHLKPTTIGNLNLKMCYENPTVLPNITLHFSPSSKLTLSLGNTFREYTDNNQKISCLAMAEAPPAGNGMSSLGNIQLQNTVVFMDLAKQFVGFLPNKECDTVK